MCCYVSLTGFELYFVVPKFDWKGSSVCGESTTTGVEDLDISDLESVSASDRDSTKLDC